MSTITLHGVDETVDRKIRDIARSERSSINQVVQSLLRKSLGLDRRVADHRKDFEDFAGSWSRDDLSEFEASVASFSAVDAEDWK